MPFHRCFYHIVWATKDRAPLITPDREKALYPLFKQKCQDFNCTLLAVNGTADRVHLALGIPPSQPIPQVIKHLKGFSSREINQQISDDEHFRWQTGYSILTISEKALPNVLAYIANQKQHHSTGQIYAYYEQLEGE